MAPFSSFVKKWFNIIPFSEKWSVNLYPTLLKKRQYSNLTNFSYLTYLIDLPDPHPTQKPKANNLTHHQQCINQKWTSMTRDRTPTKQTCDKGRIPEATTTSTQAFINKFLPTYIYGSINSIVPELQSFSKLSLWTSFKFNHSFNFQTTI